MYLSILYKTSLEFTYFQFSTSKLSICITIHDETELRVICCYSPGFPQSSGQYPAVFSFWLWYDPSWNMGAPTGTLSITPLPTALNHVKGLPVGLSSSHWKHPMKIFFSSPTLLYCPNVVDIATLCYLFKIVLIWIQRRILSTLMPDQISGTSTLMPWIPLFALALVPKIISCIHLYALELPPSGNCPVQVFVFLQDGCSLPSCVIIACFILVCLVLFSLPYSLLLFSHFSVCPLLYFVCCIWASLQFIVRQYWALPGVMPNVINK